LYDGLIAVPRLVPVFPLPEVVLFPGMALPLHIFEPRYREMTRDALAGTRCVAVAQLKPGFEPLYFTGCAPIHDVLGVGRVVRASALPDGRFDILLRGVIRARIVRECSTRSYRVAEIEPIHCDCGGTPGTVIALRERLRSAIESRLNWETALRERLVDLCAAPLSLGALVDTLAGVLPLDAETRQELLCESNVCRRARKLISRIEARHCVERADLAAELDRAGSMN
jgi:hypothetical protein